MQRTSQLPRPSFMLIAAAAISVGLVTGGLLRQARSPITPALQPAAPPAIERSNAGAIEQLQARVRANPADSVSAADLGWAWLQRVRETNDFSGHAAAEQAFAKALAQQPDHVDALIGMGSLALSRHQFAEALAFGERAQRQNPFKAQVYGVVGDALLELGRYDNAAKAIQKMVDSRPDVASYSRVSYMRELHGDTAGAIAAMQAAVSASNASAESGLWARYQLGMLHFNKGDLAVAEAEFAQALRSRPGYVHALAGLARVRAAQGQSQQAIALYQQALDAVPLPEFAIGLGELHLKLGNANAAQQQFSLVRAMQKLNAEAGTAVDLELSVFEARHGDPQAALNMARAAYAARPGIHAAHALALALHKTGNPAEATRYINEALRLGTRDAMLHADAARIARANGDEQAARRHLSLVKEINPYFNLVD